MLRLDATRKDWFKTVDSALTPNVSDKEGVSARKYSLMRSFLHKISLEGHVYCQKGDSKCRVTEHNTIDVVPV